MITIDPHQTYYHPRQQIYYQRQQIYYHQHQIILEFRAPDGQLLSDPDRFPSGIPALANYVHKLQLKFGIYQVMIMIMMVLKVVLTPNFTGLWDKDMRWVSLLEMSFSLTCHCVILKSVLARDKDESTGIQAH